MSPRAGHRFVLADSVGSSLEVPNRGKDSHPVNMAGYKE